MCDGACGVLGIEDEAVLRLVLTAVLDDEGFDVREAANGREALQILAHWRPAIIVLDLHMPVMDGPRSALSNAAARASLRSPCSSSRPRST